MECIRFHEVRKSFGGPNVLDGLSFSVEKGELLCVTGPSGTGKSVLLKHIVRLLEPDSGTVTIEGVDIAECDGDALRALRSRIGYLFQGGALLAWLTVEENVALPLKETTRLSAAEISERVRKALAAVELTDAADRYPSEISGGMLKRAGLARAIVRDCDIVLYDEPTSGLDPVSSAKINGLIRRLGREFGITSIVVTHDLHGALAIADRMLLLNHGRVVELSTPREFQSSQNEEVRAFLSAARGEPS